MAYILHANGKIADVLLASGVSRLPGAGGNNRMMAVSGTMRQYSGQP